MELLCAGDAGWVQVRENRQWRLVGWNSRGGGPGFRTSPTWPIPQKPSLSYRAYVMPLLLFSPRRVSIFSALVFALHGLALNAAPSDAQKLRDSRVKTVTQTAGLVAFWDFVQREDGPDGKGRFVAYTGPGANFRYPLDPKNISLEFWKEGPVATLADFPLLGRGPFGQAVRFSDPITLDQLPVLEIPRTVLHNTPLDIKGPGQSASMVVWLAYHSGDHAIAGIWHEGTDTKPHGEPPKVLEKGRRQFALFAGLAANPGGVSAHISENGVASFGDRYARHMATTPSKLKKTDASSAPESIDIGWTCIGFTYDNATGTVTAYNNGFAEEMWIENPAKNKFYAPAERAWKQSRYARTTDLQHLIDPAFPVDQRYSPPEEHPTNVVVITTTEDTQIVEKTFAFTKVRETFHKDAAGHFTKVVDVELIALKANPYWFGCDLYAPKTEAEGGPFTIGRVIHSNRHKTLSSEIGGVAVFNKTLSAEQMKSLSELMTPAGVGAPKMISASELTAP